MKSKKIYIRFQKKTIEISVHYREKGPELILFIHGLGCTKESFYHAFAAPELEKLSLLAPDLVGFGDSSRPDGFSCRMEDHAAVLSTLINTIGADAVHIAAHSMGGAVGLLLAEQLGEIVSSFVSVEGNLVGEDCGLLSRRTAGVSYPEFRSRVFDEIKSIVGGSSNEDVRHWLEKSDPLAFYRSAVSLVKWSDSGALLPKFEAFQERALFIYGEQSDGIFETERLRAVRRIEIPESGHFSMLDNPGEFYKAIAGHISRFGHIG
jgi:pimeloyl-ACP methyl ester carboxylesterase